MTDADTILRQYLANGEMAQHNPELLRPSRHPTLRAVTVQELDARQTDRQFRYEHDLQVALFDWAETAVCDFPELAMMYAIPNGGHRHKSVAAKLKAEGVKAGVPDVHLPVARGGYHSLYIELKVGTNQPTEAQRDWLARLAAHGHRTAVCRDLESVQALLVEYLAAV